MTREEYEKSVKFIELIINLAKAGLGPEEIALCLSNSDKEVTYH